MTTQTNKPTIVEQGARKGRYGMTHEDAIIDDARYGRLYIADGYGGQGTLAGGCYRWMHGFAMAVDPGTTLEQAREQDPYSPAVKLIDVGSLERYAAALGL
jgi:hypothetical protein